MTDMVKTLGEVGSYWLSDPSRALNCNRARPGLSRSLECGLPSACPAKRPGPVVTPDPKDRRFADPEWSSNQFFDFVKQAYLLSTSWADRLVEDAKDLDPHTRQKAEFYVKQVANALSPSNFVLTNPELLRETLGSNAENLARGMHMLAEDIEAGGGDLKIRQSDAGKFEVGRNLAVTPGKGDLRKRADAAYPVRAVDACGAEDALSSCRPGSTSSTCSISRRKNPSSNGASIRASTVFVISWVNPDEKLAHKDFEDYMREGPARRLRRDRTGDRRDQGPHHRLLRRRHAVVDHTRHHGGEERRPRRLGHAVCGASRLHPRRRPQGVRRRGASSRCWRSGWPRAAISKARRWPTPSTCCAPTT
jgi:polyhydroxyalkanoate synthase